MIRIFLNTFVIALCIISSYYIGKYNGSKHEEFEKCQEQLIDKVNSGSLPSLPELRRASFDVVYLHNLGWAYQCAFLKGY
jgi:hypothetical protein